MMPSTLTGSRPKARLGRDVITDAPARTDADSSWQGHGFLRTRHKSAKLGTRAPGRGAALGEQERGQHVEQANQEPEVVKNPVEQETLVRDIGGELTEHFLSYIRGELGFDDLTFLVYESLEDLHVIASGEYELEYIEDEDEDEDEDEGEYDEEKAIAEQEDLAQEPSR